MQFLFLRDIKPHVILLLTSMLLFTAGCEDDDHDDHDEVHTDAEGFVLEDESGTEFYREFEGAMNGAVTLAVGDTLELLVHFLDHDGDEIEHEEGEEEEDHEDEIEVSGFNSSIAVVEAEDHEEEGDHDHDEEHGMSIHIIGISSGSTSFQLQLMHEGHADYTSTNNVPVTVN